MMQNKHIRLIIRALSLGLFIFLLGQSVFPLAQLLVPVDIFLRLDPLVSVLVPMAIKEFVPTLIIGLVALGLALLVGRVFCGYICPMGISLDVARAILPHGYANKTLPSWLVQTKYLILTIFAVSAFLGVSHIFWGSPIALITRFYALLLHPILLLFTKFGLDSARPFIENFNMPFLTYLQITPRIFYSIYFIAGFFALLFILERVRPRFWCRYLCPAGAMLGLLSLRPTWRRRVHTCIQCGKCAKHCPTGAIGVDPINTKHTECITCRTCVDVCPVRGTYFLPQAEKNKKACQLAQKPEHEATCKQNNLVIPSRRAFLGAAGAGVGLASLGYINTASRLAAGAKGTVWQTACVRPPGARPEVDFLNRCIRCGQCMKVCPTNGLQPTWLSAGFEGVFSPVLMSRRGPCEPECAACGQVCPTGAIMDLPLKQKQQAKIGTAVVKPGLCLAWAEGRSCVVCQEVCAFGAISLQPNTSTKVPVPIVNAKRCFGCGFCERHCPVHIPAIVVYPLNALRLDTPDYIQASSAAGLDLIPVSMRPKEHGLSDEVPEGQLPPGFTD